VSRKPWLIDVAVTVWKLTGDTGHALPVLAAALHDTSSVEKVCLAAREMGLAARPLAGDLAHQLHDFSKAPAIVQALLRVCPDGDLPAECSPRQLADLLLTCAQEAADPRPAFEALAALGPRHLTRAHRKRLRSYATRDRRISRKHSPPDIQADELLRATARDFLESTSPATPTDSRSC
jgi:hypothetical protein